MENYNICDEIIVLLQNNFYQAQVAGNMGKKVHIIVKEKTSSLKEYGSKDMMYDREFFITQDRIVLKTYDSKTGKCLVD